VVVAVASWGGLSTLSRLLESLPAGFGVPLLVVQHRSPGAHEDQHLWVLQRHSALPVRLAQPGRAVAAGVTVMPAGAVVTLDDELCYHFQEAPTAVVRAGRGDALLASAAAALGPAVIAVVLTGNLQDGSEGCRAVKRHGGRVLVEEPDSAAASSMPRSAMATGCVDYVLSVKGISAALVALTMAPGAADLFAVATPPWARLSR
jgi:two-component system chemotaxis response regulator CheB